MTTVVFIKENLPGFENSFLLETAPQLGARESRLWVGEYILTHDDMKQYATFDDVVAHFGVLFEKKGNGFDVPYRCLIPKEVNGLS